MNFVAIDFETANNAQSSACALGLVKVENGIIAERREWLIKPTPFEMGFYQNKVHKINLMDLRDKPTFDEIWDELKPLLENQVVIAHNATFDFGVLNSVCTHYNIQPVKLTRMCSIALSRMAWRNERGYGLSTLVKSKLDSYSFNHHDALADAEACAVLVLKVMEVLSLSSIQEIQYYKSSRLQVKRSSKVKTVKKIFEGTINENLNNPIRKKEVVFTGTLEYFVRKEAENLVRKIGGFPAQFVSSRTKYLVVGQYDVNKTKSSKIQKAEELSLEGYNVQIISENEFIEMISVKNELI
ncbi:exonuclease domain-containing protein [Arcicella rosea]|uniref:DNA polymerase-3 subunit epsilon n=1 Tax=Arcicella rosea TaxID=502909 RepID=A0A841EYI9_9BACT|nr:exonuclease domain-containing protein [Arcicella rosea]MBB6005688.1 DNA polymerase-3 subunit epsilon [Arcicella rosea]